MAQTPISPATNLISLDFGADSAMHLTVHAAVIVLVVVLVVGCLAIRGLKPGRIGRALEFDKAEFGLAGQKVTLRPNYLDKTVAYKIWVELSTRKVGLEIDLENDVVSEIYDSWYAFFQVTRELIKDLPVSKVKDASTRQIIDLSIDILNYGLRPHLTKWQARFRRWYEKKMDVDANIDLHPQEIQRKFPDFERLERELLEVNKHLIKYRAKMNELVST